MIFSLRGVACRLPRGCASVLVLLDDVEQYEEALPANIIGIRYWRLASCRCPVIVALEKPMSLAL